MAIRSLLETVACQHLISRRGYLDDLTSLRQAYRQAEILVAKLHAMRSSIQPDRPWIRETEAPYKVQDEGQTTVDERCADPEW